MRMYAIGAIWIRSHIPYLSLNPKPRRDSLLIASKVKCRVPILDLRTSGFLWAAGLEFRVWGLGFRIWGLGFRVWGLGFRIWGLGFRVWGLGFRIWGLGFRVWGLG